MNGFMTSSNLSKKCKVISLINARLSVFTNEEEI